MPDEIVIQKIRKSGSSELWVVVKEYNGKVLCDIREYFHTADSPDWLPTKKGVSIPAGILPAAVDAMGELATRDAICEVRMLDRGKNARLRFAVCEYEKHVYGEIRTYYLEGGSDTWKPGKGVTFPLALATTISEAIGLAEDEMANWEP